MLKDQAQKTEASETEQQQQARIQGLQTSARLLQDTMNKIDPQLKICVSEQDKKPESTQVAEAPCYQSAIKSWDDSLNANYQLLIKELSHPRVAEIKQHVIQAERQWIIARDEQFKNIDDWEEASDLFTGEEILKPSMRGLPAKVEIVKKQAWFINNAIMDSLD